MKNIISAFVLSMMAAAAAYAAGAGQTKTITGRIVALKCYMQATESAADAECSRAALSAGEPAGLVEENTGNFYILVSKDNAVNEAAQLTQDVAKMVEVTGDLRERSGLRSITVQQVKVAQAASEEAAGGESGGSTSSSEGG
jgi:hypothetical protein